MAAPRLQAMALRLHIAGHEATVDDELEGPRPALRLRLRPGRGPFSRDSGVGWEIMELAVEEGPEDHVVASRWNDSTEDALEIVESVPASKLGATWIEAVAIAFVEAALGRA